MTNFSTGLTLLVYVLVHTIACFGLAWIVGHSRISRPFRLALWDAGGFWLHLLVEGLECPGCFGFWSGLAVGFYVLHQAHDGPFVVPLAVACYTSGANYLLGRATGLIDHPSLMEK